MKLLVDGIFYRIANTGIARVWTSILPLLADRGDFEIFMLDRGEAPTIAGVQYIPFPTTSSSETSVFNYCADDSLLIQRVCDHYGVDVFTSTFFTSPLTTPALLVVYDMIPELFGFNPSQSVLMEKDAAICYSQRYLCISENTRNDLLSFYPTIPESAVSVAYCGVDPLTFKARSMEEVGAFRQSYEVDRPYFLFVGSRVQHGGYKNSKLFFDAVSAMPSTQFDVLCVGGEKEIEPSVLARMPQGTRSIRLSLTEDELCLAYNGAEALVYPSLYEGFGMPVIEAMACGCPVITTHHGSLLEAAGDAACLISGSSVEEMAAALAIVREPGNREALRRKGFEHAKKFRWEAMAERFATDALLLHEHSKQGMYDGFFQEWRRLREIQASVDFQWIPPIFP
jgi:glycosyltransferase involved in cell wall biosynthesis